MLTVWAYEGPFSVEISILVGTLASLPFRYFLDKRYIFAFISKNLAHDGQLFVVYSVTGAITTLIFWGTEYAVHLIYDSVALRYAGALVGLIVGFYLKYQLDKKYVFVSRFSET